MAENRNGILSCFKWVVLKIREKYKEGGVLGLLNGCANRLGLKKINPFFAAYAIVHFSPNLLKKEYRFNPADLDPERRKFGISGILRVLNEDEFLAHAIESHLPFLDEIVIALNPRGRDRSYEICYEYQKKNPEKIKVYEYKIHMPIWGDKRFENLPYTSQHHFVTYSNWALSKASFKIVYPIFGDAIAIPTTLKKVTDDIRENGLARFLAVSAIDLYDEDNKLYVMVNDVDYPWKGGKVGLDLGFFPLNEKSYYNNATDWPQFIHETGYDVSDEIVFFHVKGLKKDRGSANRAGNQHYILSEKRRPLKLMPWEEFKKAYKVSDMVSSPEDLGIKLLYKRE